MTPNPEQPTPRSRRSWVWYSNIDAQKPEPEPVLYLEFRVPINTRLFDYAQSDFVFVTRPLRVRGYGRWHGRLWWFVLNGSLYGILRSKAQHCKILKQTPHPVLGRVFCKWGFPHVKTKQNPLPSEDSKGLGEENEDYWEYDS